MSSDRKVYAVLLRHKAVWTAAQAAHAGPWGLFSGRGYEILSTPGTKTCAPRSTASAALLLIITSLPVRSTEQSAAWRDSSCAWLRSAVAQLIKHQPRKVTFGVFKSDSVRSGSVLHNNVRYLRVR